MKNKKKKSNIKVILFLILVLITIYLMFRTSYVLDVDKANFDNFFTLLLKRLNPIPFLPFTFNTFTLLWLFLPLLVYGFYMREKYKPKASGKWKEKEHGSNDWQNAEEKAAFDEKCNDELVPFSDDEIDVVKKYMESVNV